MERNEFKKSISSPEVSGDSESETDGDIDDSLTQEDLDIVEEDLNAFSALDKSTQSEGIPEVELTFESGMFFQAEKLPLTKKRPVASSGSESGSINRKSKKELKRLRTGERLALLGKSPSVEIYKAQPNKPASRYNTKKTKSPVRTGTTKTPLRKERNSASVKKTVEKGKEKTSMSNRGGDDRLGGQGPNSTAVNNDEVQDYNLIEQNSEKVNIASICRKPEVATVLPWQNW